MQSSIISPPQCWSQAVVCVSTPRMYPHRGYFLVIKKIILGLAIIHEISVDAQKQLPNFEMIMIEEGIALLQLKSYGDRWTKTGQ